MAEALRPVIEDVGEFSRVLLPQQRMRAYQVEPARAIAASVERGSGLSFAVVFSRQAGKDEMLSQLLSWLLVRYQRRGGTAIVAAPTLLPQAAVSRDRLRARLRTNALTAGRWTTRDGYIVGLGAAQARFLSAAPTANVRGQTADLLLVANEAQDIEPDVWDAVFDPMAASTNATTVYLGTVWDRRGLLHRQIEYLREQEGRDGVRRVFFVPWREVAREIPAYGDRVVERIAQLGADHPFILTEYELIELDAEAGLFPPQRQAQLAGDHPRLRKGVAGRRYAMLVDVAGEEEDGAGFATYDAAAKRDATVVTIVEVEVVGERLPVYRVVDRMAWTGRRQVELHAQLVDLARSVWKVSAVVVDATGVGAGLAAFLRDELARGPKRVEVDAFVFSAASKSQLGWDVVGLIDSGRLKEYADDGDALTRAFWSELGRVRYEVGRGPGRPLRWGVPASEGHDDLVISMALAARLDRVDWRPRAARGLPEV